MSEPAEAKRPTVTVPPTQDGGTTRPAVFDAAGLITRLTIWNLAMDSAVPGYEDLQYGVVLSKSRLSSEGNIRAETTSNVDGMEFYLVGHGVQVLHQDV